MEVDKASIPHKATICTLQTAMEDDFLPAMLVCTKNNGQKGQPTA
jgi:hypothetical protein